MTDFNDWYAKKNPDLDPDSSCLWPELRKAYEAGAASQAKTLRDEFAGRALTGWISGADIDVYLHPQTMADLSYEFADAMLEARKTTGEGE
jgi:hypothetical protein